MRTTLHLDGDVLDQARDMAQKMRRPFRQVVNEAMRSGLQFLGKKSACKTYRMPVREMGLRPGVNLDNIGELLGQLDEEEAQR